MRQFKAVSASRKPVIVRKFSREWCAGFAETNFCEDSTELEILDVSGKLSRIEWAAVKWVCYVRDLGTNSISGFDGDSPERLLRRRFASRPRMNGLWVHLQLNDGDGIEGVAANDFSLLNPAGLLLTPPDTRSNTQRIFIPRRAIRDFTILAVIAASSRKVSADRNRVDAQPDLFGSESVAGSERPDGPIE